MADAAKVRIIVLISGSGTNLQALIDAVSSAALEHADIVQVISNRKAASGLERADRAGIPTLYHPLPHYKKRWPDPTGAFTQARQMYDADLSLMVLENKPDLVVCAGWMHVLTEAFLTPLKQAGVEVINLHPALPGEFNGTRAIERAYEAFQEGKVQRTGVMVHKVIGEVDMGEPVLVQEVPIKHGEKIESLEMRMHEVEWEVIVRATRKLVDDIRQRRVQNG